jgi:hypothetical protein
MPRRAALLLALLPAACAAPPPGPAPVILPEAAAPQGLGDPTRGAILSAAHVFARPGSIAGDAAAGAEALARLEFLTVELATAPRWIGLDPLVVPLLRQGRAEARAAFAIPEAAPPQAALDALFGAAAALRAGDADAAAARLTPLVGAAGVEPLLARLAAFPALPRAAFALAQAQNGMLRMNRDRGRGPWPF